MIRSGGVTFWAWTVSIAVHLIAFTGFGFVKFSQTEGGVRQRPVPTAKVSQVKKLVQTAGVIPKPKVKRPDKEGPAGKSASLLPVEEIFDNVRPVSEDWQGLAKSFAPVGKFSPPSGADLREGVEFFGSFADERKVYYVVDCSGSMQGVFGRVREQLIESIAELQPDQYFYIIFFGGDRLFEFGDGELVRAAEETKSAAYEFINSVQPAGYTNASAAFERAVQIRDSVADSDAVVYFLTDGFELVAEDEPRFSQELGEILTKFAPNTRINTIGFWPQRGDREMLETIARQSGGEFVLVDDY